MIKQFASMYRQETTNGVWDDFDYMHLIYILGERVQFVMELERLGDHDNKAQYLTEEEMQLIQKMKLRELKRIESSDSRSWFQIKLQRLQEDRAQIDLV